MCDRPGTRSSAGTLLAGLSQKMPRTCIHQLPWNNQLIRKPTKRKERQNLCVRTLKIFVSGQFFCQDEKDVKSWIGEWSLYTAMKYSSAQITIIPDLGRIPFLHHHLGWPRVAIICPVSWYVDLRPWLSNEIPDSPDGFLLGDFIKDIHTSIWKRNKWI